MPLTPPLRSDAADSPAPLDVLLRELNLKKQELRALLDITEAVNNDRLSEDELYRAFGFTLLAQLGFSPVALFIPEDAPGDEPGCWECKVSLPPRQDFRGAILPAALVTTAAEPVPVEPTAVPPLWHVFRTVLPVRHHARLLAYVLVGDSILSQRSVDLVSLGAYSFVQTLSSIVLVAAKNRRLARERLAQEVLQREIEIARDVQKMLFPKQLPNTASVSVHATYIPHSQVGGDYFDCVDLGQERYLLCVADVSGKGIPASLLMSNFQAGLRTLARRTESLTEVVAELNHLVYSNALGGRFITAFLALYDAQTRELRYVNAGHNPPLLRLPDTDAVETLRDGTLMLGVMEPLPFLTEGRQTVPPGAVLLCYTDGLTDVFNQEENEFGEQGVIERLRLGGHLPLPDLHADILSDVTSFNAGGTPENPYPDDITILSCRFK